MPEATPATPPTPEPPPTPPPADPSAPPPSAPPPPTAPSPAPPKTGKPTALNPPADATPSTVPDWRAPFGPDEKTQKLLGRYASAEAFGKAHLEATDRINNLKPPLKEGATAEETAAWRKSNNIPETADGYFASLPGGLVVGEDDKALFSEWATQMHGLNVPPAVVAATVKWYYGMLEQQGANQETLDRAHQTETTTALKAAWCRDYGENLNLMKSFLGGMSEATQALFVDATMPDGRRLMNSPEVVQWLTQKARESNPLAFIPGPGANDEGKTLEQRIEAIEATFGTEAYIKNEKVQAELRALYTRRDQLQQRGAA